jgi:hypothetical protein
MQCDRGEISLLPFVAQQLRVEGCVRRALLNTGPGEILFSGSLVPNPAMRTLRFTSAAPGTGGRAWRYEARLDVREPPTLRGPSAFDRVLFGFIQTVESFTTVGEYASGATVTFAAQLARDSVTQQVPAPWFGNPRTPTGPVAAPQFPSLTHPILIEDAPQVELHVFRNGSPIRRVVMEGLFGIRLIVHDPVLAPAEQRVPMLFHARVQVGLRFEQNQQDPPTDPGSWTKTGGLTIRNEAPGRGPGPVVLGSPLAKAQLAQAIVRP